MASRPDENGDYTREKRLMRLDNRGIFGAEGLSIPASMRRRFALVTEPVRSRAWKLLNAGQLDEAESILKDSLPRNAEDNEDQRYFGIYWGMAEVSLRRNDKIAALDWAQQGISKFPSAVRKSHLRKLVGLGVYLAQWADGSEEINLTETDAAAILARITETLSRWTSAGAAPLEEMALAAANSRLEVGSPLGRFTAARRHRK
jgi:hypothetical protein